MRKGQLIYFFEKFKQLQLPQVLPLTIKQTLNTQIQIFGKL